jgi:hypothetical protein
MIDYKDIFDCAGHALPETPDVVEEDALFIDFDAPNPSTPAKERIMAFTKRYFKWIKKAPNALVRSVKALAQVKCEGHANSCGGTGIFGTWARKCFRCTGGYMTPKDIARNKRFDAGKSTMDYSEREEEFGDNAYNLIAQ